MAPLSQDSAVSLTPLSQNWAVPLTPLSQWKLIFVYDLAPRLSSVADTSESKLGDVIDSGDTAESILEFLKALMSFKKTIKSNPS